jgi:hypothetical protein
MAKTMVRSSVFSQGDVELHFVLRENGIIRVGSSMSKSCVTCMFLDFDVCTNTHGMIVLSSNGLSHNAIKIEETLLSSSHTLIFLRTGEVINVITLDLELKYFSVTQHSTHEILPEGRRLLFTTSARPSVA